MKRIGLALSLLAAPLGAQPTQAWADSMSARVAFLEQMLGKKFVGIASSDLAAELKPENELPGGRYPYILSDYQLRVGLADGFGGQQAQITGIASRVHILETASAGGQPVGTAVFDKIRARQLCLGDADCRSDVTAFLQIRGLHDAEIAFSANLSLSNPQGAFEHGSTLSKSGDGGFRFIHNNLHGVDANGNWRLIWVTPSRPRSIWGFDSQGTLSFSQDFNGVIEPSQLFILRNDRANKIAAWTLMPAGYRWGIGSSSCLNCFDKLYIPPQQ